MDYLDSLVKKGEVVESTVVEEMTEVEEAVEQEVVEEAVEATEPVVSEPVVEEIDLSYAEDESDLVDDNTVDIANEGNTEQSYEAGASFSVNDIKIYNVPDSKSAYNIFTGNVIYKGDVAGYKQIAYMKPGFGLAIGYTGEI